tara:strand:- start:105 stop:440 length:336 start_codon:yes stop_codon:yes gene_type:complete
MSIAQGDVVGLSFIGQVKREKLEIPVSWKITKGPIPGSATNYYYAEPTFILLDEDIDISRAGAERQLLPRAAGGGQPAARRRGQCEPKKRKSKKKKRKSRKKKKSTKRRRR